MDRRGSSGMGPLLGFPAEAMGFSETSQQRIGGPSAPEVPAGTDKRQPQHSTTAAGASDGPGHRRTTSVASSGAGGDQGADSDEAFALALSASLNFDTSPDGKLGTRALAASLRLNPTGGSSPDDRAETPPEIVSVEDEAESAVTKRLSSMRPSFTSLTPRINSLSFVYNPADFRDHITEDRQRVLDRLEDFGLCEYQVQGDGNCQFRSLSDQLYRGPQHFRQVRKSVIRELRARPNLYAPYVPENYKSYCSQMAKDMTWGDNVTLQAAANHYGICITLLTSFLDEYIIKIDPTRCTTKRTLYLSFWAEVHYNSIYPKADPPRHPEDTPEPKPSKFLGSRKLGQLLGH